MPNIDGIYGLYGTMNSYQTLYLVVAADGSIVNSQLGGAPGSLIGTYDDKSGIIEFTDPVDTLFFSPFYYGFVVEYVAGDHVALAGTWTIRRLGAPSVQGGWTADTRKTIL